LKFKKKNKKKNDFESEKIGKKNKLERESESD
jgi:hypothetical protein